MSAILYLLLFSLKDDINWAPELHVAADRVAFTVQSFVQ